MDSKLTTSAIERIVPSLWDIGGSFVIYASKNQKISFKSRDKKYVYYLTEGEVDIHRTIDDLLLLTMKSPKVLGLSILHSDDCYHYIKTTMNCKLIAFEREKFHEMINSNNLWREVFIITSSLVKSYFKRDEKFSSRCAYDVIKNNLEVLWANPPNEREKTSIFTYILSRSSLSRSSLSKVLKDLSDGGYISIKRGKLLDMKNLPDKY